MSIEEILDQLDELIDRAWSLPLTGGRCVVDADKVRGILGALRGGLIDVLITDTITAAAVLASGSDAVIMRHPEAIRTIAAMIGEFTSVDMDLIWAEDMVGASVAPVLQRYTLLSVLNTVFMVLLAAGGIGTIFYYPILRLWEKYGKRGE